MKKEKFLKRCNAFYPKPLWNVGLKFYYKFLEQHKDVPVAQKLYDLMKQQEV